MAARSSGRSKSSGSARKNKAASNRGGGRAAAVPGRNVSPKKLHADGPFPKQHQRTPGLERDLRPQPEWRGRMYQAGENGGKLRGMVALVTGGDSGIGRSVAYHYAREGADVVIVCLPEEAPDARVVADAIAELGRECLVLMGDLAELNFCQFCVRRTLDAFGRLDILVHNAAFQQGKKTVDVPEDELDRTMKVNVYAYIRLAREAIPHMRPGSSIIATGSVVGLEGSEELPDYSATKGAIHAFTKTLAQEVLDKGIRVNCVAPGPVWTPLNASDRGRTPSEVSKFGQQKESSQMERPAQPEELAPAYVFLASPADSSYITGIVLPVTGGPAGA